MRNEETERTAGRDSRRERQRDIDTETERERERERKRERGYKGRYIKIGR